jgi:hypothetical protein
MTKYERYLKIVDWATCRYGYEGNVIVSVGGKPTRYTLIERMAFRKLLAV